MHQAFCATDVRITNLLISIIFSSCLYAIAQVSYPKFQCTPPISLQANVDGLATPIVKYDKLQATWKVCQIPSKDYRVRFTLTWQIN